MVLGKLPVSGRPTNSDYSRARAYCACSCCGRGLFGHFFSRLFLPVSGRRPDRLKYCLKGFLSQKQPTNYLMVSFGLDKGRQSKVTELHDIKIANND